MIRRDELEVGAGWMLGDRSAGDGTRFEEWAEARDVDLDALSEHAHMEAVETLGNMQAFTPRAVRVAIETALMQGVATGLEVERHRRDACSLPVAEPSATVKPSDPPRAEPPGYVPPGPERARWCEGFNEGVKAATPSQQEQPRCGGSGEFEAIDDTLAAEHRTEPCSGCPDCQPDHPEHVGEGWPAEVRVAVDAYGTPFTIAAGEEDEYDARTYVPALSKEQRERLRNLASAIQLGIDVGNLNEVCSEHVAFLRSLATEGEER